ncbi:hypothetical protein [Streptomyces sp. BK79]|uniref:hypothetical protein n=1 Tax=Streptomyces sp. BK79 TaxID=3350097 RepID=UPI00376FE329
MDGKCAVGSAAESSGTLPYVKAKACGYKKSTKIKSTPWVRVAKDLNIYTKVSWS